MRFADILMAAATQGGGRDPDLAAWMAAVVANGGTVSAARAAIVGQFIAAEKAAGTWSLTDDYWPLWAENEVQALTSLKQRRLVTVTAAPTFTQDRGYAFNGSTQYIDTGFIPSSHALAMSANSIHAEVYEIVNASGGSSAMGSGTSSSRNIRVIPRNDSGNAIGSANSASGTFTLPSADSRGLTQFGRNGPLATDTYGAKNGVDMTRTVDPSAVGATLPGHSNLIGAFNNAGSVIGFRAGSIAFASVGAALSGALRLARYNNVQAFATAVGAQV